MTTYTSQLKNCVKAKYGPWLLVELRSGRWAGVWYHFIGDMEREAKAIMEEVNWFYTKQEERAWYHRSPSFTNRSDALDHILESLESEYQTDERNYRHYLPILKTVRIALRRSQTKEAKAKPGCPLARQKPGASYLSVTLLAVDRVTPTPPAVAFSATGTAYWATHQATWPWPAC